MSVTNALATHFFETRAKPAIAEIMLQGVENIEDLTEKLQAALPLKPTVQEVEGWLAQMELLERFIGPKAAPPGFAEPPRIKPLDEGVPDEEGHKLVGAVALRPVNWTSVAQKYAGSIFANVPGSIGPYRG